MIAVLEYFKCSLKYLLSKDACLLNTPFPKNDKISVKLKMY